MGRAESVSLKRKLRGPLNMLLLGKTRSRSEGEEPLEVVENETTVRHSDTTVERGADLKEFSGLEGEAPTLSPRSSFASEVYRRKSRNNQSSSRIQRWSLSHRTRELTRGHGQSSGSPGIHHTSRGRRCRGRPRKSCTGSSSEEEIGAHRKTWWRWEWLRRTLFRKLS